MIERLIEVGQACVRGLRFEPAWKAEVNFGTSLACAEGVLLVADHTNWRARLRALQLETGNQTWELVGFGDFPVTSLSSLGKLILAAEYDGKLHAIDLSSGKLLWTLNERKPWLLDTNGSVAFAASLGRLGAFEGRSGARLWTFNLDEDADASRCSFSSILLTDGVLFTGTRAWGGEWSGVLAFEPASGRILWKERLATNAEVSIVGVARDSLILRADRHVVALDARHRSGLSALLKRTRHKWVHGTGQELTAGACSRDEIIIGSTLGQLSMQPFLLGIDASNRQVLWSDRFALVDEGEGIQDLKLGKGIAIALLHLCSDMRYRTGNEVVLILDPTTGDTLAYLGDFRGAKVSSVATAQGFVFVLAGNAIHAFVRSD